MMIAGTIRGSVARDANDLDAQELFDALRTHAQTWAHPRYANYDLTVTFLDGTKPVVDTWETHEDLAHSAVLTKIFSREDGTDPHVPHGSNIDIPFLSKLSPPDPQRDVIGEVCFAVDQTFGLGSPNRYIVARDEQTFSNIVDSYRVIGRTQAQHRVYDFTTLDSIGTTVHLALTPLVEPSRNRLRELWIDTSTMTPLAAIVQGIGNRGPATNIRWHVEFIAKDGGVYLARETALAPLDYGRAHQLHDVVFAFNGLTLSSNNPLTATFGVATPADSLADP
jgi:hypothetical protein